MCERRGITLIEIPFWWDGKVDSLIATIHEARPELFPSWTGKVKPIIKSIPDELGKLWRYHI
jgi:hypothetical protein